MAVVLLKLVFFIVGTLSNFLARVIFAAATHVLVQAIQLIKVHGENSQRVLEQVRDVIRACLEYIVGLVFSAIGAVVSSLLDKIREGVVSSSTGMVSTVAVLAEKSRTLLEEALQEAPEVMNAFAEMVGKIVADALNNCNEALVYVTENLLN